MGKFYNIDDDEYRPLHYSLFTNILSSGKKQTLDDVENNLSDFLFAIFGINNEDEAVFCQSKTYQFLKTLLLNLVKKINVSILIEEFYVDRVYRDSYYLYYSRKHKSYDRFCKRILLFNNGNMTYNDLLLKDDDYIENVFIGSIVVRPLNEIAIGRTLLNPKYFLDAPYYLCTGKYKVSFLNKKLKFTAFPFSMQDTETMKCAEITLVNMLDYFGIEYSDYRHLLPSKIVSMTEKNDYQRKLPSTGLKFQEMSKVLMESGFQPTLYHIRQLKSPDVIKRLVYYYVESGIPVAMGISNNNIRHSIICIGHAKTQKEYICKKKYCYNNSGDNTNTNIWISETADICNDIIVVDDSKQPYSINKWSDVCGIFSNSVTFGGSNPEFLLIPFYKHMYMDAQTARDICISILNDFTLGIHNIVDKYKGCADLNCKKNGKLGTKDNPIVMRLFMAASKNFKRERINYFLNASDENFKFYIDLKCPKFIWVCELYTKESYMNDNKGAIGEIILDATSANVAGAESALLIKYPYYVMCNIMRNIDDLIDDSSNDLGFSANIDMNVVFKGELEECENDNFNYLPPYTNNLDNA